MGDSSAVKVAIRVRPFNARERQEGVVLCVDMQSNMTRLFNKSDGFQKDFFFDHCYWSHDGFQEEPNTGHLSKDKASSKYADQDVVFRDLGVDVLNNAWEGYHTCLFAYGQTGSGKSYSMVGYGNNKGIIPLVCEEIFKRVRNADNPNVKYDVKVSMLEIYNEKIQDLLQPPGNRTKEGLRVREHPALGVYVEGISKLEVKSYEEISAALEIGNQHRTIAATQMNATSSRAHTVLTISFTQTFNDPNTGQPLNRKQSDINLVDLAGSERAAKTGATGDRLQEGSSINLSLSTLGRVITALAKKGAGEGTSRDVIPYRDSKLTRILQNALGGNSKTTMIAAISPALFNFDETLSTLRYADQVKAIKNLAIVNETAQEKLIRELREENEKLKAMLEGHPVAVGGQAQPQAAVVLDDETRLEYERLIDKLKREKEEVEQSVKTAAPVPQHIEGPHLANLNEDPLLSGNIKHPLKQGANRFGKRDQANPPDFVVEGLGIGNDHCRITLDNGRVRIFPSADQQLKTYINGKLLTAQRELENQDRIRFGNHNYFLFIDPEEITRDSFDWEFAMNEANEEGVKRLIGEQEAELRKKEDEMRRKLQEEWQLSQKQFQEERAKLDAQMKEKAQQGEKSQKALVEKERELLARQKELEEEMRRKEKALKQSDEQRQALDRLRRILSHCIQRVNEANERAVLLGKEVRFLPELYREASADRTIGKGLQSTRVRVKLEYEGLSSDIHIQWALEKLEERLVDMQELSQQLMLEGAVETDKDPFVDRFEDIAVNSEPILIGHCYVYLETVYFLLAVDPDFVAIFDDKGHKMGALRVEVTPRVQGVHLEDFDNVKEFVGSVLQIQIRITEAADLPAEHCTDVFCAYKLPMVSSEDFRTEKSRETTQNPRFNYSFTHEMTITAESADELQTHALAIRVYGDIDEAVKRREFEKVQSQRGMRKDRELPLLINTFSSEPRPVPQPRAKPTSDPDFESLRRELDEKNRLIEQLQQSKREKKKEPEQAKADVYKPEVSAEERKTEPEKSRADAYRPSAEAEEEVTPKKSRACEIY